MTTISTTPVRRETGIYCHNRPLIVELHPGYLTLREKGRRHKVHVGYSAVLDLGYKLLARAARAEKLAARKSNRRAA